MEAFDIADLIAAQRESGKLYLEFLRVPALSAGLYVLSAGAEDPQQPHAEDEVYHVLSGQATIRVADEDRPVEAGSIVYVPARVPHRFHTIEEDLSILVFFAPAEASPTADSGE